MKKQMLSLLFSTAMLTALAQPAAPDKYGAVITKDALKKQLTIIAGPEMEGRETGTEGQRKAADYIVSQFKAFGLTPAPGTDNYQQYYPIGYDTLLNSKLSVGDLSFFERNIEIGSNENALVRDKVVNILKLEFFQHLL